MTTTLACGGGRPLKSVLQTNSERRRPVLVGGYSPVDKQRPQSAGSMAHATEGRSCLWVAGDLGYPLTDVTSHHFYQSRPNAQSLVRF